MNSKFLLANIKSTFNKCYKIAEYKENIYGASSVGELGIKGEFLQIHRKYTRLKKLIWLEKPDTGKPSRDALEDTLHDMINYCAIILALLEEKKNGGTQNGRKKRKSRENKKGKAKS